MFYQVFQHINVHILYSCIFEYDRYKKLMGGVVMPFVPKKTSRKEESSYKSIYLKQDLINAIDKIATDNDTSFNNVVVSMIEKCLEEE